MFCYNILLELKMNYIIFGVLILVSSEFNFITAKNLNCHIESHYRASIIQCLGANSTEPQILQKNFLGPLFLGFDEIKTINLTNNNLFGIETNWTFGLNSSEITWTHFYFCQNNLIYLDAGVFDTLENMNVLGLNDNMLITLPVGVFNNNKKLRDLNLSNNNLTTLESNIFHQLKNLESLNLMNNKLNILPLDLFTETKFLMIIDISKNNLINLDSAIFHDMPLLVELNLSENPFIRLSPSIFNGLPLRKLNLNHCKLDVIDINLFAGLNDLVDLDISFNNFTELPERTFRDLQNLKSLYLNNNINLTQLPLNLFDELEYLEYLRINDINLIEMPPLNLQHLKFLYIENNQITTIKLYQILNLSSLKIFDFSFNKLSGLSTDILEFLDNVEKIEIKGNPWYCPCLSIIEQKRLTLTNVNPFQPFSNENDDSPKCINYLFADIIKDCNGF